MKQFSWRLAVLSAALLSGCAGFNAADRAKNLKVGMTREEVVQTLGKQPLFLIDREGKTDLKFYLHEIWKGNVPYYVTMGKDGRMESWRADEEEWKRDQEAAAQKLGLKDEQKAAAPPPAAPPVAPPSAPAPAAGPNDAGLQKWIAGRYMSYIGSTYRVFILSATGRFVYSTESSYSGQEGQVGGTWGVASQSENGGVWTIEGDKTGGRINLQYNGGKQETVTYKQGSESGVMLFNGITFAYESAAD